MNPPLDRREFLARAAAVIPLMHAAGFGHSVSAMIRNDDKAATRPAQANPAAARFARLKLRTHVLDEMAGFYRQTLGLPVTTLENKDAEHSTEKAISIAAGQTTIEFAQAEKDTQPFYHFAFNIPHNKLDAAIQWMKPRQELIKRDTGEVVFHFPNWDAHAIYFFDPAGNIVEFIARHTLKNDAPGEFGVKDVLCASEIGLVTPDVGATSEKLKRSLTIDAYRMVSDEFAPIGDEHGLFIVVKTGRKWFASDLKASVHPAEASVRGAKLDEALRLDDERFEVRAS